MANEIKQKEKLLIIRFLEQASDEYSNRTCNDWKFPSDWTKEEKIEFCKEFHEWNGDSEEFNEDNLRLPDFAVMSFLAHKLYQTYI